MCNFKTNALSFQHTIRPLPVDLHFRRTANEILEHEISI